MIRPPRVRGTLLTLSLGALLLLPGRSALGQDRGILFGIVVDDATDAPLPATRVQVVGSDRRADSDEHGMFVLPELPLGRIQLRIEQPGYATVTEEVEIASTALLDLEVRLVPVVAMLQGLSITAVRPRRPSGYSVAEVRPEDGTDKSALDLLASQVPGLRVAAGRGVAGQEATLGIRGVGTINGGNAPLIYLDGIRISDHVTRAVPNGVNALSVLAQMPAKEVARIVVLRGPAAAMYPDAANGVILIETVGSRRR